MPDWLTYVLTTWVLIEVVGFLGARKARRYLGPAILGSVLPDTVKAFYLLKAYADVNLIAFSVPLHTPIGVTLVAGLAATFFDRREWREVLAYMLAGVVVHLAWDFTLHPYGGGQLILFPLSFREFSLGWIWPDSILPVSVAGLLALSLVSLKAWGAFRAGNRRHGEGL